MYLCAMDFELKVAQFIPFSGCKYDAAIEGKIGLYEARPGRYTVERTSVAPFLFAYIPDLHDHRDLSWYVLNPDLFEVKYFVDEKEVRRSDLYFIEMPLISQSFRFGI